MAGVSTGVCLLTTSGQSRLIDSLIDFFEFSSGSITSAKGDSSGNTNGATAVTGVNGVATDALSASSSGSTGFIQLQQLPSVSNCQSFTIVLFYKNTGANWPIIWGELGNSTTTLGYRAAYFVNSGNIAKKDSSATSVNYTIPAHTNSTASNSFSFLCLNVTTNTYPSQTVSLYSSTGSLLTSSTQNFGMTNIPDPISTTNWTGALTDSSVIDKVAVFSSNLTSAQITFLYNSGNGRSYSEIQNYAN